MREREESEAKKRLCARRQYQYNNDKDFLNLYFSYCFSLFLSLLRRACMEVVAGFLKKEYNAE
jgi:hypothetical protein